MLSHINCGHCGEDVAPQVAGPPNHQPFWREKNPLDNTEEPWFIAVCPNPKCTKPMLYRDGGPPEVYPPALPDAISTHVPEEIREEAHEAMRCLANRTWHAAALMARRALEAACVNKGATPGGTLGPKLTDLKKRDLITARVLANATALKIVGDDAAHGGPRILQEDAEATLWVMKRVLESLYDDEKITDDLKAKHAKKKP